RTYARVGGRTPQGGPPNGLDATALVEATTRWMAVGPVGQMVSIDLNYFLDGWLFAGRAGDWTPQLYSQLNVVMRVDRGAGFETMFFGRGALFHSTGLNSSLQTMNGWPDADWNGSWANTTSTLTSMVGNDVMYDVDYAEVIPSMFQMESNTPFALQYSVSVSAINNLGPQDAFATGDFSNTSGMSLSTTTPGFTIQETYLVPEPSVMIVFGLAALSLRRHRCG
ncbi:MAG TPA: hypothetical protein PK402_03555, partial [Tepidisphaeraceae bacterium]|nr:hypothetical protein [Tepidisphaeraceae bacterium]